MDGRMRGRVATIALVAVTTAASALFEWRARTPVDGARRWTAVVAVLAAVAVLVGSRRKPPRDRAAWAAVAAAVALTGAAAAVGLLRGAVDPARLEAFAAVLGTPTRVLLGIALVAMLAARAGHRDRYLAVEAVIVTLTLTLVLCLFVLRPLLDRTTADALTQALSLAPPLIDLFLVAVAARLALGPDARTRATVVLLAAMFTQLVASTGAHWARMTGGDPDGLDVAVLGVTPLLLLAAAALDPTGDTPPEGTTASGREGLQLDAARLATMVLCALVPQFVVLGFAVVDDGSRVSLLGASVIAVAVTSLALTHLWGLAVNVRDLTLRDGEDRLASLVDRSSDVVILVDQSGQITYTSGAMATVLGYATDRWFRWSVHDLPIAPTHETWLHTVQRMRGLEPEGSLAVEVTARHGDGSLRLMEMTAVNLTHHSAVGGIVVTLRDVTATRTLQGQLRFRADHDELTGLANRSQFLSRLNRDLQAEVRPVVMFIDLDDFKSINDTLGHEAGDVLLRAVANRLLHRIPDGHGLVARLGGDEFAVILSGVEIGQAAGVASLAMADLREPIALNTFTTVSTSCSIGIAQADRGDTASVVLRNADFAMYRAKRRGKGFVEVFDAELEREVARTEEYRRDLLSALGRDQFSLVYQPIVRVEDGRVMGAEALLRWNHHAYGAVQPNDFIELAEQTGVIVPIGWWTIRTACAAAAAWPEDDVFVTVNVSGTQLRAVAFVDNVREALEESGLAPHRLVLEITESMLIDDPHGVADELVRLRGLGVRIALDDFGTGYSSLAYVQRLPLDIIKIDREFVQTLDQPRDQALTRTIAAMAGHLGLETIAEGVESERQAEQLEEMGCTYLQGFLFAHPLSAASLSAMLVDTRPEPLGNVVPFAPPRMVS